MNSVLRPRFLLVAAASVRVNHQLSPRRYLRTSCCALTANSREHQQNATISYCYQVLEVHEDCEYGELRESYLRLAKDCHPDSPSGQANASKFALVKDAYERIVKYRQEKGRAEEGEEEQMTFDIRHTAPQHRQYLSYEGVGFGTPTQRHRQYQHYKVIRATDNIYEYRTQKMAAKYETALTTKDKAATRKRTIRNAMDRLVEDLIAESMAKGAFDNLPGTGKPLDYSSHNPMVDTATHNLNKILIDNGYVPEWVTLQKDIRKGIEQARQDLLNARIKLGPAPLALKETQLWESQLVTFHSAIELINAKINKMNMVTPSLLQQMVHYNPQRQVSRVLVDYKDMFERGEAVHRDEELQPSFQPHSTQCQDRHSLREVWLDWKALFSSRKSWVNLNPLVEAAVCITIHVLQF